MLTVFFIAISHCAWRHFISWSFAATKKRSKENAFPQSVSSVPSVHAHAFGSRVERCLLERRILETLLLANPDIPTLRHQCSRASSVRPRICSASPLFAGGCEPIWRVVIQAQFSGAVVRASRGVFQFFSSCAKAYERRSLGHRSCPRALVAKRGDVRIREKEGFKCWWF
jgi:hypothetical protein